MHETGCLGPVNWDNPEGWNGEGGGRGLRMGDTCTPMADSSKCMAKPTAAAAAAKLLQSCLTLCDPIDGSPRDSPVPGILQARTLDWVAISFTNA